MRKVSTTAAALLAALLVGCGGAAVDGEDAGAEADAPEETEQTDDAQDDETDDAGSEDDADDADDDSADDADDAEGDEEAAAAGGGCELARASDGEAPGDDEYTEQMGDINYELEQAVGQAGELLEDVEAGDLDRSELGAELEPLRATYDEATAPAEDVVPPEGAEDWHEQVMDSWESVCEALDDGIAGSGGDDARYDAFVTAITDYPGLYNELHANTMVGPFEEG